jgi:hypothetical protein
MRHEWLAEEDLSRAMQLVINPLGALQEMAPDFKRVEADMETVFWGSRYARP